MSLAHGLLGLLEHGPAHGYSLCRRLNDSLGEQRPLEPSHVYAALLALEAVGAVVEQPEFGQPGRRRVYSITAAGTVRLRSWLARQEPCRTLLRRPLLLKSAIVGLLGERMSPRVVRAERARRERQLRILREPRREVAIARLLRERAARHLEVELWLLDQLPGPEEPGSV